jgi:hypothetical protein
MVLPLSEVFWHSLTWFGDSGFLLPAALWIAVWLGIRSATRPSALLWLVLFGVGGSLIAASKVPSGLVGAALVPPRSGHGNLGQRLAVACWLTVAL